MSPRPAPDLERRRAQIVEIARRIAEAEGWPAVTTRRVAHDLGVTQPVLYSAFPGRQQILDAVALDGFRRSAEALEDAPATPQGRLEAYLAFAAANPEVYEAMFSLPTRLSFASPDTPTPLRRAFAAIRTGFTRADDLQTEAAWALMHGLATLQRSGRVPKGDVAQRTAVALTMLGALEQAGEQP